MAKQTVGLGTVANDGTGDSIRAAFDKVNDNFDELYLGFPVVNTSTNVVSVSNTLYFGNTTANAMVNSTSFAVSNSILIINIDPSQVKIGNSTSNTIANSTSFKAGANMVMTTTHLKIAGAVGNATVNSTIVQVANTTGTMNVTPYGIATGTLVVNTTVIQTGSANLSTNTLSLGTSSIAANGYSRLPNGLMLQWGVVSSNSSVGNITFPALFSTLYSLQITPITATHNTTYLPVVIASNTSTANVRTGNTTAINVHYMVIGT